jgi:HSP20 family protein
MSVRCNHPFHEAQSFQNQMSRFFNEGFGTQNREDGVAASWAPPVDIAETPETLNFTVEVPGFKNEDLTLRVENGVLTVEGERKFDTQATEKNYHRVERSYGKFVRGFTLPSNIDPEKVHANLVDGVLYIALQKREEAKPKTIAIGAGGPKQIGSRKAA